MKHTRLDQHIGSFEHSRRMLDQHAHAGIASVRLARGAAFKMAQAYLYLQSTFHNELVDFITPSYPNVKDPIDAWINASFQSYVAIGEDPYALIRAIGKGMTRKQHNAQSPRLFLNATQCKRTAKAADQATALPREPSEQQSVAEQRDLWRDVAQAAKLQLKKERAARRASERRVAQLEREMKRLLAQLALLEKKVAKLLGDVTKITA